MRLYQEKGGGSGCKLSFPLRQTWPFRGAPRPPQLCHAGTEKAWEKGQELVKCTLFTGLSRTLLRGPGFLPCTGKVPREARSLWSADGPQVHPPLHTVLGAPQGTGISTTARGEVWPLSCRQPEFSSGSVSFLAFPVRATHTHTHTHTHTLTHTHTHTLTLTHTLTHFYQ